MSAVRREPRHRRGIETRNLAPVQDAVRDYRVIEDGAYAHHLQEQEIEYHYSQNVNMRKTVQEDIRKAKELQDEEDRSAQILTVDEEEEIRQMDEELAEIIQQQIFTDRAEQEKERKEWEERDKELALLMEEKERRKAIEDTKRKEERDFHLAKQFEKVRVTPDSEDGRRMRVMSDEELAKRLQKEEHLKVRRDEKRKQDLKSVELQDEELAKYMHEKDIQTAEYKYRKERKKRKGKHQNEPLYYDDNIDPPDYRSSINDGHDASVNGHRQHSSHRHQQDHRSDRRRPTEESPGDRRPRHTPDHDDRRPRHTPERDDRHHRHIQDHDDRRPRHTPDRDDRLNQEHSRERRHHRSENKPDRPPPPNFSDRHNTEIKVPLDEGQQRNRERAVMAARNSPVRDTDHSDDRHSSHQRRGHSEKTRHSREISDDRDQQHYHRSRSEKSHQPRSRSYERELEPVEDVQYNEKFAEIAEQDMRMQDKNMSKKSRKNKGGDCKQQ